MTFSTSSLTTTRSFQVGALIDDEVHVGHELFRNDVDFLLFVDEGDVVDLPLPGLLGQIDRKPLEGLLLAHLRRGHGATGFARRGPAAVAAATVGFDGDWHIPNGMMFTIGI